MSGHKLSENVKVLLILPVAILLVSGCVNLGFGGQTGAVGNGIVITSFEPSLSNVDSADKVTLHVEVQNKGEMKGTAAATLMGIYGQQWRSYQSDQLLGELIPANPDAGTEGQVQYADWVLTAPDLQRGEKRTYNPRVRVFYSYETRVSKPITFVTTEELRRIVQTGDSLSTDPTVVSAGPLSVDVKAGQFVKTNENWQQSYFPVQIDITNTGGGLLAGENYPVGIEVEAPPGTMFRGECPRTESWGGVTSYGMDLPSGLTRPVSPRTVYLWNGRDTKVVCELKVVNPPEYRQERELKITLKYIYYTDRETQITVTGTTEWGY